MDSIVGQADRTWLCAMLLQVPWILEMLLEDILESKYLYCQQNIAVPFLIYSAVLLYPRIDSILEIFYVSVLDILEMWLHWTNHTVWTIVFLLNWWNQTKLIPDEIQWFLQLVFHPFLSILFLRVNHRRRMIHR